MTEAHRSPDRDLFTNALTAATYSLGIQLDAPQLDLIWTHYQLMAQANKRFNLTRITDPADAAVKHYADSLTLLTLPLADRQRPLHLLDVGTGAGLPAVPLAILCPAWSVTAIDGTAKKIRFLAETAQTLGLNNLTTRHARAADLARDLPGRFDLIILRAVTKIAPGLTETHSLLRHGGFIVFYKTALLDPAEFDAGRRQAAALRLIMLDPVDLELPTGDEPLHRRFIIGQRPRR
jgi:16S rRNA (guanine527-N7)-methyltransferase